MTEQQQIEKEFLEDLQTCLRENKATLSAQAGKLYFSVGDGPALPLADQKINVESMVDLLKEIYMSDFPNIFGPVAISEEEFEAVRSWFSEHKDDLADPFKSGLQKLIANEERKRALQK